MACRGVLFAISDSDLSKLRGSKNDDELLTVVEEIEERWEEQWLYQLDKAWDAIHRSITDGSIGFTNGTYPLSHCILGGGQLHKGDNYIVSLKTASQATEIAAALRGVTASIFQEKYESIDPQDYGLNHSQEDLEYSWNYFDGIADFYVRAAAANRHVIFTVDQ